MNRFLLPLVAAGLLAASLSTPTVSAAGKPPNSPDVSITSVALVNSGCGVENFCVEVKWNVQNVPANPQVMSFEVSGTMATASGSCPQASKNISDNGTRAAKLGFFQAGACTGTAKSANVTVKLFTRDIEGQKVLASTANKAQTF